MPSRGGHRRVCTPLPTLPPRPRGWVHARLNRRGLLRPTAVAVIGSADCDYGACPAHTGISRPLLVSVQLVLAGVCTGHRLTSHANVIGRDDTMRARRTLRTRIAVICISMTRNS